VTKSRRSFLRRHHAKTGALDLPVRRPPDAGSPPERSVEHHAAELALEVVGEVVRIESERENNLNARATAVATATGVIVTLAAAVAKPIFREVDEPWSDLAIGFFVPALFALAVSMLVAVWSVLKPKRFRPSGRKALGGDLIGLWLRDRAAERGVSRPVGRDEPEWPSSVSHLLEDSHRVRRWYLDQSLRALASWWSRNVRKQDALRRSYVFLAFGLFLLALTGLVVLGEEIWGPPGDDSDGSLSVSWLTLVVFLGGAALFAAAWWRLQEPVQLANDVECELKELHDIPSE
jgi:hypothetical protein